MYAQTVYKLEEVHPYLSNDSKKGPRDHYILLDDTATRPHYFVSMRHIEFRLTGSTAEPSFELRRLSCFAGLTDTKRNRQPKDDVIPTYYVRLRGKCVAWTTDLETARRVADAASVWGHTQKRSGLNYTEAQALEDLKLPHVREMVASLVPLKLTPKEHMRQHDLKFEALSEMLGLLNRKIDALEKQLRASSSQ